MTSAYDQGHIPAFEMRHRLQLAREYAGLGRAGLAERMDISRNSVINAETGRTRPRKLVLNAWALACGVPVDWLITGQPTAGPPGPDLGTTDYKPRTPDVVELRPVISAPKRHRTRPQDRAA